MRKLILPALLVVALIVAFTGCSRDASPPTAPGNTDVTNVNPMPRDPADKDRAIDATKPSFTPPAISIVGQTDTTITVRVCGTGTQGAPAGFSLQFAVLGCGTCASYVWNDATTCWISLSGVPSGSRYNLAPGQCVDIVVGNLLHDTGESDSNCPVMCGTNYVFRAFAHATSTYNRSPFTANLCTSTLGCAAPAVACYSATDTTITVTVTAGAGGAPAGIEVWVNGSLYTTTSPLGPNASTNVTVTNRTCGTSYTIKVRAAASNCTGGSAFSSEITCCTNLCLPSVVCGTATATSISLTVTAGGGAGAPGGVAVYVNGTLYTTTGALGANESTTVDVTALDCGTSYTFTVQAPANGCYGASATSTGVSCCTNLCAPTISCGTVTSSSIALNVTAGGGAGAPGGLTIDFAPVPTGTACADYNWSFYGEVFVTDLTQPVVFPDLECNTTYVFRALATASGCYGASGYTPNVCCSTESCEFQNNGGCTRTRGFWATHGPGACHQGNNADLLSQYIGSVSWCNGSTLTADQACQILNATGGGCNQLGAQLLTALLNQAAFGTTVPSCAADALTAYCAGAGCTSTMIQCLDTFNNSGETSVNCPSGF